ncbi:MAG: gamma-glutamyltransferase [Gammaproteobacteria bacterium]|nr:MAG: gamma-glutamyltransferase [Gammaproteobacteria bacterium]
MRCFSIVWLAILVLLHACNTQSELPQPFNSSQEKFAVASAHPLATQAGIEILQQGGNAFDAAVAVTAVLAVVEPYASGLGGGGFWLLHVAAEDHDVMIDGREVAPQAATRDMYIDEKGMPTKQSVNGPLAAGIPGTPAAMAHLSEQYGRLPLKTSLNAAIELARNGFVVSEFYISRANAVINRLKSFPQTEELFLQHSETPQPGYVLQQSDLAQVLEEISQYGEDGFYRGEVANKLVTSVQQAGGIWQLQDLVDYKIIERQPVIGEYKNIEIVSAALPSSGGIVLMQILNMLSNFDLQAMNEVQRKHLIVEAMRRAYHDRAAYLGDADYVDVAIEELLSTEHAEKSIADLSMLHATPSQHYIQQDIANALPLNEEAQNTTHFSILDQQGNQVAATLSINYYFGSGFVAEGTGVLLNNEMNDFAIQPGHANLWGLVGSEANSIDPGKRMLSSMSPTFLFDGERTAILGTPGGSRIISMVLLSTLAFAEGASALQMVKLPRFHHQYLPDEIQFETGALTSKTQSLLESMGHTVKDLERNYGNMHAVIWNQQSNTITAASDPRGIGLAKVGP